MKTVELYGKYLDAFLFMDPFGLSCVIGLKGSFALGTTVEQEDGTDRPAGIIIVSEDDDRLIIDWVYVRPEYREQGIGSHLMALVFEEATRRDMDYVAARISDEFDGEALLWDTFSFFVNDVYKDYEKVFSEIRFSMGDISKLLRAQEKQNEAAATDKTVIPLRLIPQKAKDGMIAHISKNFSSQLFAPAKDLFAVADENMSFIMVKNKEIRGAFLARKIRGTWYIYSLVARDSQDMEQLVRAAMYHCEEYAKLTDEIRIQPQKNESITMIEKMGIKYRSYEIHFITASLDDYKKQKKMVATEGFKGA